MMLSGKNTCCVSMSSGPQHPDTKLRVYSHAYNHSTSRGFGEKETGGWLGPAGYHPYLREQIRE